MTLLCGAEVLEHLHDVLHACYTWVQTKGQDLSKRGHGAADQDWGFLAWIRCLTVGMSGGIAASFASCSAVGSTLALARNCGCSVDFVSSLRDKDGWRGSNVAGT